MAPKDRIHRIGLIKALAMVNELRKKVGFKTTAHFNAKSPSLGDKGYHRRIRKTKKARLIRIILPIDFHN
jgi:hypothetical protein